MGSRGSRLKSVDPRLFSEVVTPYKYKSFQRALCLALSRLHREFGFPNSLIIAAFPSIPKDCKGFLCWGAFASPLTLRNFPHSIYSRSLIGHSTIISAILAITFWVSYNSGLGLQWSTSSQSVSPVREELWYVPYIYKANSRLNYLVPLSGKNVS